MEEALKALNITPKVLARRTNALWDILLPTKQQAKELAGSVLNTKNLHLQTEDMGTCRTKVTIHGVSVDISEDRMGSFFTKYSEVSEVKALMSKANIATVDMELYITVNRKNFQEIPNILVCRDRKMLVVVEDRRPCCWSCGASGHMAKECPGKCIQAPPRPATKTSTAAGV